MNLNCNFKPPKRSQHQRLMSAAASSKQQVDTHSLTLLRIVNAILSRFKHAHLAFPHGRKSGFTTNSLISESAIEHCFPHYTPRCLCVDILEIKYYEKKIMKIIITVRLSRDIIPKYPVRCPR